MMMRRTKQKSSAATIATAATNDTTLQPTLQRERGGGSPRLALFLFAAAAIATFVNLIFWILVVPQYRNDNGCNYFNGHVYGCPPHLEEHPAHPKPLIRNGQNNHNPPQQRRVAILVAGTLQRYMLNSTLHHLIRPLVDQGHLVDYYLSLNMAPAQHFQLHSGYMDRVHWDPLFSMDGGGGGITNVERMERILRQQITQLGGHLAHLILGDNSSNNNPLDSNPLVRAHRALARLEHPDDEDPDLRFPILDRTSPSAIQATIVANRNLLRLHLSVRELWRALVQTEDKGGVRYDLVLFLRDDSFWLADFDLNRLVSTNPQADLFALACDDRQPLMAPEEMNDHAIISQRKHAHLFGNYFTELFEINREECNKGMTPSIRQNGKRGCNPEMLLKYFIHQHNLQIQYVGQALIPFERSVNVLTKDKKIVQCYHYLCQSKQDRLELADDSNFMQKCTDLQF